MLVEVEVDVEIVMVNQLLEEETEEVEGMVVLEEANKVETQISVFACLKHAKI